jgi:dinuclear metal center YbgI/SA1388 family protein
LKINAILAAIEEIAPNSLQESWDNSGLIVGDGLLDVDSALITLDVTEAVVDEAIANGNGLILAHHPLIFGGLKRLNGKNDVERAVMKAVKNDIAIYAAHTNLDVVSNGVSWKMAQKLGLENISTLSPQKGILKKLVAFIPVEDAEKVRAAVLEAGAGAIGQYDYCSFNSRGKGTFRAGEQAKPYVGEKNKIHSEEEVRFETIFPDYLQSSVISALLLSHPYEEVAYDIYLLENKHAGIGLGVVGDLPREEDSFEFLQRLKSVFDCKIIRYTGSDRKQIRKIAVVGGAGSDYLKQAIGVGADLFITGDFKYHQFFDAENKIIIADIGHYESEQFTKELFYEIVTNKFPKFALRLSTVQTNPINYLF